MLNNRTAKKTGVDVDRRIANVKATQAFEQHEMSDESERRCRELLFGSTTSENEIKKILASYNVFKN